VFGLRRQVLGALDRTAPNESGATKVQIGCNLGLQIPWKEYANWPAKRTLPTTRRMKSLRITPDCLTHALVLFPPRRVRVGARRFL
jgi:hypothetical protein